MAHPCRQDKLVLSIVFGVVCAASAISGVTGAALNSPEAKAAIKVK